MSDVAMVWLKLLRPWRDYNAFQEAAVNLESNDDPNFHTFVAKSISGLIPGSKPKPNY